MVPSQPLAGIVGLVVVVALLGGMAFLGLSGTDLANFNTSAAEARARDQQTSIDAKKAEIDLEAYKENAELDKEFQQRRHELELQKLEDDLRQQTETQQNLDLVRVEFDRALRLAALITGSLAALMLCAALTYAAVRFTSSRFPVGSAADAQALRDLQKVLARRAEMDQRAAGQSPDQQQAGMSEHYAPLFQSQRSKITR